MSNGAPLFEAVTLWWKFSGANAGSIVMPTSGIGGTEDAQWMLANVQTDALGDHVLSTDETFFTDLGTAGAFSSANILAVTQKGLKQWNVCPCPVRSGTLLWCTTDILPAFFLAQFTRV